MIAELQAALSSTQAAFGIAAGIQRLSTDAKVNQAIIEIQSGLLNAQASLSQANDHINELTDQKRKAEEELIRLKDWRQEASRYELKQIVPGILFYALKEDQKGSEPAHYLCPKCFVKDKKSFLQKPTVTHLGYKCYECDFEVRTEAPRMPRSTQSRGGYY